MKRETVAEAQARLDDARRERDRLLKLIMGRSHRLPGESYTQWRAEMNSLQDDHKSAIAKCKLARKALLYARYGDDWPKHVVRDQETVLVVVRK